MSGNSKDPVVERRRKLKTEIQQLEKQQQEVKDKLLAKRLELEGRAVPVTARA